MSPFTKTIITYLIIKVKDFKQAGYIPFFDLATSSSPPHQLFFPHLPVSSPLPVLSPSASLRINSVEGMGEDKGGGENFILLFPSLLRQALVLAKTRAQDMLALIWCRGLIFSLRSAYFAVMATKAERYGEVGHQARYLSGSINLFLTGSGIEPLH